MDSDILIIGAGPAGCSAALTAINRGRSVLMLDSGSSALLKASKIDNYPGVPDTDGKTLLETMQKQVLDRGGLLLNAAARQVTRGKKGFRVLAGEEIHTARGLILCCGTVRSSGIPGEKELTGNGVSYCTTCDGMLYRGKQVAVITDGGCDEEIAFLASIAGVTCFGPAPSLPAGIAVTVKDEKPKALLEGPVLKTEKGEYPFACVFILRPSTPPDRLIPSLETENGRPVCDENGRCSVPFVYAAGDLRGQPYQIAAACGQGCAAALALDSDMRKNG